MSLFNSLTRIHNPTRGLITVNGVDASGNTISKSFQCTADGSTDDYATINAAMALAITSMPCVVEFGPGDYAITRGVNVLPATGSRGLTIRGAGASATRIKYSGGAALSGDGYIAFKIKPTGTPSKTDTTQWLQDILVEDIAFFDSAPFDHQERGAGVTGTAVGSSGSATVMTDTGASFTTNAYVGYHLANTTDKSCGVVLSNTATTVTVTGMVGGTDNTWAASDGYEISTANSVEETHAISIQYALNASIRKCAGTDMGDEAFNLTFVHGGSITGLTTINCPSISPSGAAITVQHGCKDVVIDGNALRGSDTIGTISSAYGGTAIGVEVLDTYSSDNITIANNQVRDFGGDAFMVNTASDTASNISITGNTANNCQYGFQRQGSTIVLSGVVISGNTFDSLTAWGVNFDTTPRTNTYDITVANNIFVSCTTGGATVRGENFVFSDNVWKTCERGILINDGENITISGGIFDGCGGTNLEEIEDITATYGTSKASDLVIVNSAATVAHIKGVEEVKGVTLTDRVAGTEQQVGIRWANIVTGCNLECGILLRTDTVGGIISNNIIGWADTGPAGSGSAIELVTGNDNCVITNNTINMIPATNNQYCIELNAGAENNIISGNSFRSDSAEILVSSNSNLISNNYCDGNIEIDGNTNHIIGNVAGGIVCDGDTNDAAYNSVATSGAGTGNEDVRTGWT